MLHKPGRWINCCQRVSHFSACFSQCAGLLPSDVLRDSWLLSRTCCRLGISKVLTVQVEHTGLLQFVHFRYCRSPSLIHQPVSTQEVELLWVLRRVLLVCSQLLAGLCCANPCKALCFSHTQPNVETQAFVFCCSNLWALDRLKIIFTSGTREQLLCFPLLCSHVALYRHLNVKFCCLSGCFQVDDFTISILDTMKEIAQYPSAIRQMLWAATHTSDSPNV